MLKKKDKKNKRYRDKNRMQKGPKFTKRESKNYFLRIIALMKKFGVLKKTSVYVQVR